MPESTKQFFHCLANEGRGGSKCSPEPKLQEIREMPKSNKNCFTVWPIGGGEGGSKCSAEPKLQ